MEIPIDLQEIIDPEKECCCVYHFSNMCKEWALSKKIYLMSTPYSKGHWVCSNQGDEPFAEADNEADAIFQACQWIYNNRIKK
jgi:hypothetical protein